MKALFTAVFACSMAIALSGCDELFADGAVTEQDVIMGLKEALVVGTDTAVSNLSQRDGFFGNTLVQLALPDEAKPIYNKVTLLPFGIIGKTEETINRAAEDAVKEAVPIFADAIYNLTIEKGWDILRGDDTAATQYLREQTREKLYNAFRPVVERSLKKELVFNISAESMYETLVDAYNTASLGGLLFDEIKEISLVEHTTNGALRGLFLKVQEEETNIRNNPLHRVTELLEKVFAEQD